MTTTYAGGPGRAVSSEWRSRDIVVTAVIGVAFGVVFWAWSSFAWGPLASLNVIAPVAQDLFYAVWLVPAVLAPLVVRKPGAALFAEVVAAGLSALLATPWGIDTLISGFLQGGAAELVFLAARYRVWTLPVLAVAAVASSAAAWIHDWILYYGTVSLEIQVARGVVMAISAVVIAALGSVLIHRSLKQSGVLEGFPD